MNIDKKYIQFSFLFIGLLLGYLTFNRNHNTADEYIDQVYISDYSSIDKNISYVPVGNHNINTCMKSVYNPNLSKNTYAPSLPDDVFVLGKRITQPPESMLVGAKEMDENTFWHSTEYDISIGYHILTLGAIEFLSLDGHKKIKGSIGGHHHINNDGEVWTTLGASTWYSGYNVKTPRH